MATVLACVWVLSVSVAFANDITVDVPTRRTVYLRMEEPATASVTFSNVSGGPLTDVKARWGFDGFPARTKALGDLPIGGEHTVNVDVDTSLKPNAYRFRAGATAMKEGRPATAAEAEVVLTIVSRPLPHRMPVVLRQSVPRVNLSAIEEIGFTHSYIMLADHGKIEWKDGVPAYSIDPATVARRRAVLDQFLAHGLTALIPMNVLSWIRDDAHMGKYQRIDRSGSPYSRKYPCLLFNELQGLGYSVGASLARNFSDHPAVQGACVGIGGEERDGTNLCFHEHDRSAFRRFAGFDVPEKAVLKQGLPWWRVPGFPANRVLPDKDPLLTYYRWFWKDGDGGNAFCSSIQKGLDSDGRKGFWTFVDPAIRVPSLWGSGGDLAGLSHWTYTNPDPLKMGLTTDELFAMASGHEPAQQVMKMTQLFWYRSLTAPKLNKDVAKRAPWEKEQPDAEFITIAPDHLREALWLKLSRPIAGIMYHGWESVMGGGREMAYRSTNPQTRPVLTQVLRDVVRPYGSMLLQLPDWPARVGLLESFCSQVLAQRRAHGWASGWGCDVHLILQWAHLQPRVLYEESVVRDGLDDLKVLVMPSCDVLPGSVVEKVLSFQKRGGIVVADENLTPAIVPDIVMRSYQRTRIADQDKAALVRKAAALREQLDVLYLDPADASTPDVIVRLRRYRSADYLFAINDKRTYGDYVGHHRLVMEKGSPVWATLRLARRTGFVYDLVAHRQVSAARAEGSLQWKTALGPGEGRLYLVTNQPIASIGIQGPAAGARGSAASFTISALDPAGEPVSALLPFHVEVLDAENKPSEFSGYYGVRDGVLSLTLDVASNDAPGAWTIRVTDLASGKAATATLQVK